MTILEVADELGMDVDEVRGHEHMMLCPVHGDTEPSLQVNEEKDEWFCFGCSRGGGIYQFIQHYAPGREGEFIIGPRIRPLTTDPGVSARAERLFSVISMHPERLDPRSLRELDRMAIDSDDLGVLSLCMRIGTGKATS